MCMNEATNICSQEEKTFLAIQKEEKKALNYFGKFWKNQACVYQRFAIKKVFNWIGKEVLMKLWTDSLSFDVSL